jgi:dolichyldiphosphatase
MQQAAAEAAAAYRPFSYTHVVYVEGDRLGWALSGAALLPIFIVVAYATLIASRRDLATVAMLIGQLANEGLNFVLKRHFKEERPTDLHPFAPRYGMPSNHSQFMGFLAAYAALWCLRNWRVAVRWRLAAAAAVQLMAAIVAVSRIYLRYHSIRQVAVGLAVGAAAGATWYVVVELLLRPRFAAVAQWRVCRWLLIRDLSDCANVLAAEYTATTATAKATGSGKAKGM